MPTTIARTFPGWLSIGEKHPRVDVAIYSHAHTRLYLLSKERSAQKNGRYNTSRVARKKNCCVFKYIFYTFIARHLDSGLCTITNGQNLNSHVQNYRKSKIEITGVSTVKSLLSKVIETRLKITNVNDEVVVNSKRTAVSQLKERFKVWQKNKKPPV